MLSISKVPQIIEKPNQLHGEKKKPCKPSTLSPPRAQKAKPKQNVFWSFTYNERITRQQLTSHKYVAFKDSYPQ